MKRIIISAVLLCALLLTGCGMAAEWQNQYDLGIQALYREEYAEAVNAFNAAIQADPKNVKAYIGLADAYIGSDDLESAVKTLDDGLALIPAGEDVPKNLAIVQYKLGTEYYSRRYNTENTFYNTENTLYDPARCDMAVEYLEAAVENGYKSRDAYILLANAYMLPGEKGGQIGKAVELLKDALENSGGSSLSMEGKLEELSKQQAFLDGLSNALASGNIGVEQGETLRQLCAENDSLFQVCYDGERVYYPLTGYDGHGLYIPVSSYTAYYGDLENGLPSGSGTCIYAGRSALRYYEGQWADGKPNGSGTAFIEDDNAVWTGEWKNGYPEGQVELTIEDGGLFHLAMSDGEPVIDDRWRNVSYGDNEEYFLDPDEQYTDSHYVLSSNYMPYLLKDLDFIQKLAE